VAGVSVNCALMKAFLAIFVYLVMALILGAGVLLAVIKGSFWLLIIGFLGFVLAVTKIAILHH
jgi:hypothetical protein